MMSILSIASPPPIAASVTRRKKRRPGYREATTVCAGRRAQPENPRVGKGEPEMLEASTPSTGRLCCSWRVGAFIRPIAPSHSGSGRTGRSQLKSRRRRTGAAGLNSDPLHAVPLPRASSGCPELASTQRCRRRARWPAARVGTGTSRNIGSLSSAAPQTLADPAVQVHCGAEDAPNGRSIGSNGGSFAARGVEVEVGCSGGGGSGGGGNGGDVRVVGGEASTSNVSAAVREEEELPYMGAGDESVLDREVAGSGAEEREVELGGGIDDYSRQLIGGLTKLARSGLWKASFKVLRVEQALHARKVAAARGNGEEYPLTSWRLIEPKAYNTILAALSRAGKWEEAVLLLKEMETREIPRDAVSYACLIAACGRGMQWKKALSSLVEMREAGIKANSFVYSAAIDACAKGRQWQKALVLLREMEVVDGLPGNLICYNAAAGACGKAGRPGEALALLSKMRKVGIKPNEVSYLSAISACSRVRDWQQALWLLDEMTVFGVQPDLKCYCSAITACGKGGKWKQALEVIDAMHRDGPPPNDYCYNAAISACGKSGQWHRSKDLLSTMKERGVPPDLISYNSAIDACGKGGRWEEGLKIFVDMVKASEDPWDPDMDQPKSPIPDATTYGAIITACSRGGQWQMALRFLDDMEKKGVERTEGVFQATLAGCARMGRWKECIVTLDLMQRSGLKPRVAAYNSVITACGRGGQWQRAIKILQQMSARGATPDVITLNAAMTACVQSKHWKQARTILDFMRDPSSVPTNERGGLPLPVLDMNGNGDNAATARLPGGTVDVNGIQGAPSDGVSLGVGVGVGVGALAAEARGEDVGVNGGAAALGVNGGGAADARTGTSAVDRTSSSTNDSGGSGGGGRRSPSLQRQARVSGSWPPRPDSFSFHTVIKALATAGMWKDALEMLEEMADERRRFLRSEDLIETGNPGQWPVNIDRFRSVFQLELKNNEIVGHERGWSDLSALSVSPEVALRAKAMDVLRVMEAEDKEVRLKRQALYETIAHR